MEQRSFVYSVMFLIIFSALIATMPVGLQGLGAEEPNELIPIDPNILAGFSDSEDFVRDNFTTGIYAYDLGGKSWLCFSDDVTFELYEKILYAFIWLGGLDAVSFISDGTDRGTSLSLTEIETDSDDGIARYSMFYYSNGATAGDLVCVYNSTTYDNATIAWMNDGLYLLHGIGFASSATSDIGSLLVGLLLFQLPDVPPLVGIILSSVLWVAIVWVLWYVIKEMIPF